MLVTMIFERGFAVVDDIQKVYALMYEERELEIRSAVSIKEAYAYCCEQYVRRWIKAGNKKQAPLILLEDLMKAGGVYINPFAESLFRPVFRVGTTLQEVRVFSIIAPFEFAYVDNIENACVFMIEEKRCLKITEHPTIIEAQKHANNEYLVQQMAMGAYLKVPVQVPTQLLPNEVFCGNRQALSDGYLRIEGVI